MKFTRTFEGTVGQPSTGTAGPDQIEYDLDMIAKNLDPLQEGGGIGTENCQDGFVTTALLAALAVTAEKIANGAVTDSKIGNRTVDQTQAPSGNTATLTQLLSWLANRIKDIKGTASWTDGTPATTKDLNDKFSGTSGHKHTGAAGDAPPLSSGGIEDGAVTDAKIGDRTVDQTQVPSENTGSLTQLMSWIVNRIKDIKKTTNWYDNSPDFVNCTGDTMSGDLEFRDNKVKFGSGKFSVSYNSSLNSLDIAYTP